MPSEDAEVQQRIVPDVLEIHIPAANVGSVPCGRLDTRLTARQQTALRRLFDGLQADDAVITLPGGEGPLRAQGDVVRWILDQVADAIDLKPSDYLKAI